MIKLIKFFVILITFGSCISNAGLLGASTFEECLLDNLKNAKTSEAVNAMTAACSMKFNKPVESAKSSGLKICKIYWDGWKFVLGGKPNKDYNVYRHSFQGADALEISIPSGMAKFLEVETTTKQPIMSYDTKYGKFFSENYPTIRSLCAFN